MRKFRKICKNPFLLSFICVSFLLLSFNQGSANSRSKNAIESFSNVSAKDVFRSVVFADGPLTSKITSLKKYDLNKHSLTNEQIKEYRKMESHIMSHLENINPNYFENFRDVIKSHDLNLISSSLGNISENILLFLKKERENNRVGVEDNLKSFQSSSEEPINIDGQMIADPGLAVLNVSVAVLIGAVVVIMLVVANSITEKSSELIKLIQKESLSRDKLIVDISKLLV